MTASTNGGGDLHPLADDHRRAHGDERLVAESGEKGFSAQELAVRLVLVELEAEDQDDEDRQADKRYEQGLTTIAARIVSS